MKYNILILLISLSISSCYNYDGPTRPKLKERNKISPRKLVQKELTENPQSGKQVLDVKPNITSKEYLDNLAIEIKRTIPSAQVQVLEDSLKVLFPDNILYQSSAVLPEKDINVEISKLAKLIIKYEKTNVLITGHTDKKGVEQENKRLSDLRAGYIKELLLAYKAPANRINSWGLGSSSPIASERTKEGVIKNRRVEFVIMSTIQDEEEL